VTAVRVALLQPTTGIDVASNTDVLVAAIASAADGGATMLFTPEMSGLLDRDRVRAEQFIVEEAKSPVLERVCQAARHHCLWVALGSMAVRDGDRWANRSFMINAEGAIVARYDKMHLFDVDLPTGESWRESNAYAAGNSAIIVATPVGRLGLSICYDLRFPALFSALSEAGATVLAVPSAFTVPTGIAHWHALLRARAIENACWVIAAAQTGLHDDGRSTYGHSLVVDPWGEIVLDMGSEAGLGFAEVEADVTDDVRSRIPVLSHRRPIAQAETIG
jgi:deaminated glutathione amidase